MSTAPNDSRTIVEQVSGNDTRPQSAVSTLTPAKMVLLRPALAFGVFLLAWVISDWIHGRHVYRPIGLLLLLLSLVAIIRFVMLLVTGMFVGSRLFVLRSLGRTWSTAVIRRFIVMRTEHGLKFRRSRFARPLSGVVLTDPPCGTPAEQTESELTYLRRSTIFGAAGSLGIAVLIAMLGLLSPSYMLTNLLVAMAGLIIVEVIMAALLIRDVVRKIRSGEEAAGRYFDGNMIAAMSMRGVRPRDLPVELLDVDGGNHRESTEDIPILLRRYYYEIDSGNIEAAEALLVRMLAYADSGGVLISQPTAFAVKEAAFFYAYLRGDAETARMRSKGARGAMELPHTTARIRSAVAFAEGKLSQARVIALKGLQEVDRSFDPGMAAFDKQFLDQLVAATESTVQSRDAA